MEKNFWDPMLAWRREQRRRCSRLAWALVVYLLSSNCAQMVLSVPLLLLQLSGGVQAVGLWLVSMVSSYGVGFPLFLLLLRDMPPPPLRRPPKTLTPEELVEWGSLSFAVLYVTNLATLLFLRGVELLIGRPVSNPVDEILDFPWICTFLMVCVLAPIFEELMFRKHLLRRLLPWGERFAVAASALCFALIHGNLSQIFYAFCVGLVLGKLAVYTGNIRQNIMIHGAVNLLGSGLLTQTPWEPLNRLASVLILCVLVAGVAVALGRRGWFRLEETGYVTDPQGSPVAPREKWKFFLWNPGMAAFLLLIAFFVVYLL